MKAYSCRISHSESAHGFQDEEEHQQLQLQLTEMEEAVAEREKQVCPSLSFTKCYTSTAARLRAAKAAKFPAS